MNAAHCADEIPHGKRKAKLQIDTRRFADSFADVKRNLNLLLTNALFRLAGRSAAGGF